MRQPKKLLALLLLMIIPILSLVADNNPAPIAHYMLGSVDTLVEFSIEILEDVLPFDLDSDDVSFNSSPDTKISGLQIGSYSLVANTTEFDLSITHTPLVLYADMVASGDPGTIDTIDYQLYVVQNYSSSVFKHCLSTGQVTIAGDDSTIWTPNEPMLIVQEGLFVSLDDGNGTTATTIDNLKSGTYRSTITFVMTGR